MKFSLKTLAAAVALAAVAGSASAAIDNGAGGNGELFFSAWDGATSYNFDLNLSINAYETNLAVAGKQDLVWGADFTSSYGSWLATANTSNLQWSILATDTVGARRILSTVGASTLPAENGAADLMRTAASNIQTYLNAVNPLLTGNSLVTVSNTAPTYAGNMGANIYDKFSFDTSAGFANNGYANGVAFQKTAAGGTGTNPATNNAYLDEGVAVHAWVDGNNTLHIAAVQAVPEPSEYALLLAGLGLMGAVARRRSQKQA